MVRDKAIDTNYRFYIKTYFSFSVFCEIIPIGIVMAKPVDISPNDLIPNRAKIGRWERVRTSQMNQMTFKLPPEFIKEFKQEALNRGMKLNELMVYCFENLRRDR